MRIKNQKANAKKYKAIEQAVYNELILWLRNNLDETLKSKSKIIQDKLLLFFDRNQRPQTTQVTEFCSELLNKYLLLYPDVKLLVGITNSLDDDKCLFFDIYLKLGKYYERLLIQQNRHPNIDGKDVILDIEITQSEIDDYCRTTALVEGNFEEV